jgi:DNA modification methylase
MSGALDEVGWVQNVVVNRRSGRIIDGHLRVELATKRGEATVPVVFVDLDEEDERLVLATLDPIAAMAEADIKALAAVLDGLEAADDGLQALLDDLERAHGIADLLPGLEPPDEVVAAPDEPYVERGDLYLLGEHRLLCGDGTSGGDVARLLDGATPGLMVTDPPYGVDYDPSWRRKATGKPKKAKAREGRVANDDRADWSEAWALSPADVAYVWHGGLHAAIVAKGLDTAGYELRAQIIWAKPSLVMGRGDYHWQHEPCWYAVREGATGRRTDDKTQSTLWQIESVRVGDEDATVHGTQKPVECMARPMRNHEPTAVYDPFVGSGTTIIAAEQLGRTCYAMDIDPRYVQVAKERWETFTGQTAEKAT